jgi:integrase/recombinase XerD
MGRPDKAGILFFSQTYEFLMDYLPRKVGRSPETVRAYTDSLSVFRRWLLDVRHTKISDFYFGDCTKSLLLEFMEDLERGGKSASCRNLRLSAIRSYIRFAADGNVALESVAVSVSKVPVAKDPKKSREVLEPEALAAMFDAPGPSRIGVRDRTILILLYDSAIRVAELVGIAIGDLSIGEADSARILIHGKGNKERVVAVTGKTARHLAAYLQVFHPGIPSLSDPLFYVTKKDEKSVMSEANVERIVRKYAAMVRNRGIDIPDKVYPHMFRRTRATELYRNGVPLELVSRMLGHSSVETTRIYATPSIEMLRAAVEAGRNPMDEPEEPLWTGNEDLIAARCGLR